MNQSPRGIVVQVPSTKEMSQAALNPGAILEGLNPAQLHAVTSPAPVVQILAPRIPSLASEAPFPPVLPCD